MDWDGDSVNDLILGAVSFGPLGNGALFGLTGGGLGGVRDLAVSPAERNVSIDRKASLGFWLEKGDGNHDGFVDIYTGAHVDATPFARPGAGGVIMIGECGSFAPRDLSLNPPELGVYGAIPMDFLGARFAVTDLDDDGYADVVAGAYLKAGETGVRPGSGAVYIVLGRPNGAACSVVADAGTDASVCGSKSVPLDGSASVVTGCSVLPEFHWTAVDAAGNRVILRDWNTNPLAAPVVSETVEIELSVRCGLCAGPCLGTDIMQVVVDPATVPPDLGNSLRAVRAGISVDLQWGSVPDARTYSLYVSDTKGAWPPPSETGLIVPMTSRAEVVSPPPLLYYRAAGANCAGNEGL